MAEEKESEILNEATEAVNMIYEKIKKQHREVSRRIHMVFVFVIFFIVLLSMGGMVELQRKESLGLSVITALFASIVMVIYSQLTATNKSRRDKHISGIAVSMPDYSDTTLDVMEALITDSNAINEKYLSILKLICSAGAVALSLLGGSILSLLDKNDSLLHSFILLTDPRSLVVIMTNLLPGMLIMLFSLIYVSFFVSLTQLGAGMQALAIVRFMKKRKCVQRQDNAEDILSR